ncbi:hypothetical protein PV08_09501 [Exophiala spinifera]|uniref:C2H2-type domain-containing protein n=1 Tax=Exophiala spinifera TaxID=91928 RepID=A0A0D2B0I0_9EURO|nr:uncharacterized protein PV08_09501 [Exophiala spinifera]KIW12225.1 hypothetical protein PV08_09501 [Exophiala spinifera]
MSGARRGLNLGSSRNAGDGINVCDQHGTGSYVAGATHSQPVSDAPLPFPGAEVPARADDLDQHLDYTSFFDFDSFMAYDSQDPVPDLGFATEKVRSIDTIDARHDMSALIATSSAPIEPDDAIDFPQPNQTTTSTTAEGSDNKAMPFPNQKKIKFSPRQIKILHDWLVKHLDCPYASAETAADLSASTGLTIQQVRDWLSRTRQRKLDAMLNCSSSIDTLARQLDEDPTTARPMRTGPGDRNPSTRQSSQASESKRGARSLDVSASSAPDSDLGHDNCTPEDLSIRSGRGSSPTIDRAQDAPSMIEWWFGHLPEEVRPQNSQQGTCSSQRRFQVFWDRQLNQCDMILLSKGHFVRDSTLGQKRAFLRLLLLLELEMTQMMMSVRTLEEAYYSLDDTTLDLLSGIISGLLDSSLDPVCDLDKIRTSLWLILRPLWSQTQPGTSLHSSLNGIDCSVVKAIKHELANWTTETLMLIEEQEKLARPEGSVREAETCTKPSLTPGTSSWWENEISAAFSSRRWETGHHSHLLNSLDTERNVEHLTTTLSTAILNQGKTKSVASASTAGSARSRSSYASLGSRRGRRRWGSSSKQPFNMLPSLTQAFEPQGKYHCTFCDKSFAQKKIWKKHERSIHLLEESWICEKMGPGASCDFCGASPFAKGVYCPWHNTLRCWTRPETERTFYRKQDFVQHLRGWHKADLGSFALKGSATSGAQDRFRHTTQLSVVQLTCYFCGFLSSCVDERLAHVGRHFDEGVDMAQWKRDCPEESNIAPEGDMHDMPLPEAEFTDDLEWMDASYLGLVTDTS